MVLKGKSRVTGSPSTGSIYVLIPSKVATDSMCPIKRGDTVQVLVEGDKVIIEKIQGGE